MDQFYDKSANNALVLFWWIQLTYATNGDYSIRPKKQVILEIIG